jgi:hypothetical protein
MLISRAMVAGAGGGVSTPLMLGGVALLGVVTAALASWFVERFGRTQQTEDEVLATLLALRAEVAALRQELQSDARVVEPLNGPRATSGRPVADSLERARRLHIIPIAEVRQAPLPAGEVVQ